MLYSELQHARNLQKEEQLLYKCRREELQKHVQNQDKLQLIETQLKEVKLKRRELKTSIISWVSTTDLPCDLQDDVINYYCEGNDYIDQNFFRYVRRVLGEKK